jgi:hypothetical protein
MSEPAHQSDVRLAQPLGTVEAPPTASKSSGSAPVEIAARPVTPVPVAWRSWPIVDSLADFLLLTIGIVATIGIAYRFAGPLTAIAAAIVLMVVTWRYFVPTMYELSALGVSENCVGRKRRIPWISIDRYLLGRRGAYLSSAGAPLEMLRGLYLPWGSHREQVITTLRYYLPRAEDVNGG